MRSWKNHGMGALSVDLPRRHVVFQEALYLVPKHLNAHRPVIVSGGEHFNDVAPHAEFSSVKSHVVALILNGDKFPQDGVPIDLLPLVEGHHHLVVALWGTKTINTGHAGHHDDIPALKEGTGGRMTQFINFVIDGSVLFNIGVRRWNVRLRLIKIIITHKIAYIIFREKRLKFAGQLSR